MEPARPTGQQYEIERDGTRAIVTEVGATLRTFEVDGQPCVDGFGPDDLVEAGRGQVLVPFPNRVADGRYTWEGQPRQLPINEVARGHAVHGFVRSANWVPRRQATDQVTLGLVLHPQDGYPFVLDLALTYTVRAGRLTVEHSARNVGRSAAPFGAGFHPYLTAGSRTIDGDLLQLPAARHVVTDDRLIPTGTASVEGTELDFRRPRPIGDLRLDTGFTGLLRDGDGWARVRLQAAGGGRAVELLLGPAYEFLQVFTGDELPEPRRRSGLAVEPYTCAANAFNNGLGLTTLAPGAEATGAWGISVG